MIKEVGEDHLELTAEALSDLEELLHAQVNVPVRQAAQDPPAALASIVAKDGLAEVVERSRRVREHVGATQASCADPRCP